MPIPTEKILEAAARAGFDSELRVVSMLREAGWSVDQNVYYIDKDEKKGRELDIHAYKIFSDLEGIELQCYVQFCVEVKKTSRPFIFFTNQRRRYEGGSGFALLNWRNKITKHVLRYEDIEQARPMASPERMARSYCDLSGKTEQIQGAVLSAVKGAIHYRDGCNETYSEKSRDICFFIPMIVVDGFLYECFFEGGSSELKAEPVNSVVYMQNYMSESYGKISTRVTVITSSALPAFLQSCHDWGAHMLSVMVQNRDKSDW